MVARAMDCARFKSDASHLRGHLLRVDRGSRRLGLRIRCLHRISRIESIALPARAPSQGDSGIEAYVICCQLIRIPFHRLLSAVLRLDAHWSDLEPTGPRYCCELLNECVYLLGIDDVIQMVDEDVSICEAPEQTCLSLQ